MPETTTTQPMDFQSFLDKYGLTAMAADFSNVLEKYKAGEVTKPLLYQYVMINGQLELSDYQKMTSDLNQVMAQGGIAAPSGTLAAELSDVPASERRQDMIFHQLLDYLRLQKLHPDLERRLFNIFQSYLKNIRDENETRETLSKELSLGGMAFDLPKADEVVNLFNEIIKKIQESKIKMDDLAIWFREHYSTILLNTPAVVTPPPASAEPSSVVSPISKPVPAPATKPIPALAIKHVPVPKPDHDLNQPLPEHIRMHQKEIEQTEIGAPMAPLAPKLAAPIISTDINAVQKKPIIAPELPSPIKRVVPEELRQQIAQTSMTPLPPVVAAVKPEKKSFFGRMFGGKSKKTAKPVFTSPQISASIQPAMAPEQLPPQPQKTQRPRMDDVTYAPKLFGPVDELSSLSLADFRRLAKDPTVAANKIKDKLELMAHESLDKRAQGMAALMKSELYRQYSDIMNASVLQGRPFNEILETNNTLTEAEFRALMQLNKELRS